MNVTKDHIKKYTDRISLKTEPTQETYSIYINKFLEHSNLSLDEKHIISFINTISKNAIHTAFYAIKFFYKAIELPLSIKITDVATKSNIVRAREILTVEEVIKLINGAKLNCGTIELGYIYVLTVYGARRVELYNMKPEHINIDGKTFDIYTAKGGQEKRTHLIDEETGLDIMKDFKYGLSKIKNKPKIQTMNMFFDRLCEMSNIELRPRLGLHSCRRSLVSELMILPEISPTLTRHFLRWKPRAGDVLLDYTILNPAKVDNIILNHHPFLPYWK